MLLAGAGLMLRSFFTMYRMDIGIDTSRLVTTGMIIPATKYAGWEDRTRFLQRIDEHFATVSAIEGASTASAIPFGGGAVRRLEVDGRAATPGERLPEVTMLSVGSRYFDVIGVRLLRGRAFTNEDGGPGRQIAIVNQRLVDQYFKGQDPIGRTIRLSQDVTGASEKPEWLTVVGLVPNVRQRNNNQEREPDAVAYITHRQNTGMARAANVLARTRSDPAQATRILREAMMGVDPDQALATPRTMDEALAQNRWLLRVFSTMFSVFAVMALVLAAVGLVCRHGICRDAAYPRHRRADGSRRAARPGDLAVPQTIDRAVGDRADHRRRCGDWCRTAAAVLSRADECARPADTDFDRRAAHRRGLRRVHRSCPSRDASRSAPRAAS